jgi:hypothetical protein
VTYATSDRPKTVVGKQWSETRGLLAPYNNAVSRVLDYVLVVFGVVSGQARQSVAKRHNLRHLAGTQTAFCFLTVQTEECYRHLHHKWITSWEWICMSGAPNTYFKAASSRPSTCFVSLSHDWQFVLIAVTSASTLRNIGSFWTLKQTLHRQAIDRLPMHPDCSKGVTRANQYQGAPRVMQTVTRHAPAAQNQKRKYSTHCNIIWSRGTKRICSLQFI